jgi:hypothetical protein
MKRERGWDNYPKLEIGDNVRLPVIHNSIRD